MNRTENFKACAGMRNSAHLSLCVGTHTGAFKHESEIHSSAHPEMGMCRAICVSLGSEREVAE